MIQNENKGSHQTAVAICLLGSQYLYQKANCLVGISAVWGGIPLLQTWMHQLRNGRWSGEPISKVIYFLINTQPYKATSMFFLLCVRMKNCSYFSTHVKNTSQHSACSFHRSTVTFSSSLLTCCIQQSGKADHAFKNRSQWFVKSTENSILAHTFSLADVLAAYT